MKIIAKYIGEDQELGYREGEKYDLIKHEEPNGKIIISRHDGCGYVVYDNKQIFEDDWKDLTLKKK